MSVESMLTVLIVMGSLIILLQLMATIAWWRRGSKFGRMEMARRELIAREELTMNRRHRSDQPPTKVS
jgi:hypothetical protein